LLYAGGERNEEEIRRIRELRELFEKQKIIFSS